MPGTKTWWVVFLTAAVSGVFGAGCSRKKMNDRDARKEQMRHTAEAKRQELQPAAGRYRGLLRQGEMTQDISLDLEVKDVPDSSGGEVDPVLVPTLAGSMRLTFGHADGGEFYAFAVQKVDFDSKRQKIDLVVTNQQLKEIVMSLDRVGDGELRGNWTAPGVSAAGEIELKKANELNLRGTNLELKGEYSGHLTWAAKGIYQLGLVTISTSQDKPDAFSISGNVKMIAGDPSANEALNFTLDQIEFNPITRQISLKGSASEVYFIGQLVSGSIVGDWYSKLFGKMGRMVLERAHLPQAPPNLAQLAPIKGSYYGTFRDTHSDTHLPARIMLTLVPFHDVEKPGGQGVSGNIRFYYGSYSTSEYVELPFTHLEYNFFQRNLDAKTSGFSAFTVDSDINQGVISGTISDDAFGVVGTFTATQTLPDDEEFSMGGDYTGHLTWEGLDAYQGGTLNIVPTFNGEDSLKLTGTAKLVFGDARTGEQLVYRLDETEFNPTTGLAIFKARESDVTLKGHLEDGAFVGEWFTTIRGRMGGVVLSKRSSPPPPSGATPMNSLRGTYQGTLRDTSPQTDLPDKIMVGLVTSPDLSSPRGIRVTGNVRLYMGPFNSDEYVELPLEDIQFDFYTRKLAGKTSGDLRLTLKGDVGTDAIQGQLFHDSLGEVGQFEVTRP